MNGEASLNELTRSLLEHYKVERKLTSCFRKPSAVLIPSFLHPSQNSRKQRDSILVAAIANIGVSCCKPIGSFFFAGE
jgi:hypothetical protein